MSYLDRSEGKVMELDDRLARLEQAVAAKIQQVDLAAEHEGAPFSLAPDLDTPSAVSSASDVNQDGVRRIQDGVRRLSVEQEDSSPSLDATELLIADTNERRLTQALSAFELAWLHEHVAPTPGAWSAVRAVEEGKREKMALELRELVDDLVVSPQEDVASPSNHQASALSHTTTSSAHSDLFHWREDVDSQPFHYFGAPSSFPSSPHSPATSLTEHSSPATPHSPYSPFQVDYSQPQVAPSLGVGGGADDSPIAFGKLRLDDEEMADWESSRLVVDGWGEKGPFAKQGTPLFAPRRRARTLDEAFRPNPPPSHQFDCIHRLFNSSPVPPHHSSHSSLGLWDAPHPPPPPSHSSLGLLFDPFPPPPTTSSASHQAPLTRTHSLDSTPSTPPPFGSSPLAADRAPAPPTRAVKHGH